jgi:IS5 family transposase
MGLVDKILESFKHWVNFKVQDFHDEITEDVRNEYHLAKQEHGATVVTHQHTIQALANLVNTPGYQQAKLEERNADKARITARKAETKPKITMMTKCRSTMLRTVPSINNLKSSSIAMKSKESTIMVGSSMVLTASV